MTPNPTALFRSLIVYAICVPLAIFVGYTVVNLTNYQDSQSYITIAVLAAVLIFPLLMKWHYQLMIFSFALPATVFFLPGRPSLFIGMVAVSLTISVIERILNKNQRFLPAGGVQWPLLALLGVVIFTAKLTGGFGLRSMGSDVYGGKKYIFLMVGICSYFAFIARPIPKDKRNLYVALYFAGGLFAFIPDLYPFVPSPLHFIFYILPPSGAGSGDVWELGVTRLAGVAATAGTIFYWMLARYGIRGTLLGGKLWRPVLMGISVLLVFYGGFRASILGIIMVLSLMFVLEKMHRTGLMLVVVLGGLMGGALLVPLAPHLPFTFQRSLAFLPLDISADARSDAEDSTEWRLNIWQALLPEIPKYLLLGKGYSFSSETFNDSMGTTATFSHVMNAKDNPLALSSDFHSGPLSIIIPFGIWGGLVWLWYWAAGFRVVWRNYKYGDPDLKHLNIFFFTAFVAKCITFLFIFGNMAEDVMGFAALIGFSVALNRGVKGPQTAPKAKPVIADPRRSFAIRPALQR